MATEIIVNLAMVAARTPLRALADVALHNPDGEITIRRCAVFQKPGEPPWANLPRLQIEKNGNKQFVPLVDLSRDLKKRVLDAVLDEYQKKAGER